MCLCLRVRSIVSINMPFKNVNMAALNIDQNKPLVEYSILDDSKGDGKRNLIFRSKYNVRKKIFYSLLDAQHF